MGIVLNDKDFLNISPISDAKEHSIKFVCEDSDEVVASKSILAKASPVFKAMFYGPLSNHDNGDKIDIIMVKDITSYIFQCMLRYIDYSEIKYDPPSNYCQSKSQFFIEFLYAAKKYMIQKLEEKIINLINDDISLDNAVFYIQYSRLFEGIDIHICWKMLALNVCQLIESSTFLDMACDEVIALFIRDDLMCSESQILRAILRWIQYTLDGSGSPFTADVIKRRYGKLLHAIRFPLLSLEELTEFAIRQKLLVAEDLVEIMFYHTHLWSLSKCTFSCKPRQGAYTAYSLIDKVSPVAKMAYVDCNLRCEVPSDTVSISFTGRLILTGLVVPKLRDKQVGHLKVFVTQEAKVLYQYQISPNPSHKDSLKLPFPSPAFLHSKDGLSRVEITVYADPPWHITTRFNRVSEKRLKYGDVTTLTVKSKIQCPIILGLLM